MKPIQYLEIVKRALKMTWNNKFLWVFGLCVFVGGLASNVNFNLNSLSEKSQQVAVIATIAENYPVVPMVVLVIVALLLAVLFFLKFAGIAGIIKSANNIAVYRQSKIAAIFSEVKKYIWTLLLLEIIIGITLVAVFIVLFIPVTYLYAVKEYGFFAISLIIAGAISAFLIVIGYYLRQYTYFYIVLGNMKIRMALESAYALLQKNVRESLIMGCVAILAFVGAMATAAVFAMLLAIVTAPFALALYFIFAKTGAIIIMAAVAAIAVVILLIFFSWYAAFAQTIWILFFQEISFEKQSEKKLIAELESAKEVPSPEAV